MKKLYEKHELGFALIWIGIYVVLFSISDNVSATIGIQKITTAPLCIVMVAYLYLWLTKNKLLKEYGLCKAAPMNKSNLFYIPLIFISTTNIWFGIKLNLSILETVLGIISMLCVGFIEEIVFRGFLFKALSRNNLKQAIIISSITFGVGHIVNLLNGAEVFETLLQVCYAIAIGFLFTIMFYKGKSLWPCIITHGVVNSLSIIANENARTRGIHIACAVVLCLIPTAYAFFISKQSKTENA